jgi:hypothetical protein
LDSWAYVRGSFFNGNKRYDDQSIYLIKNMRCPMIFKKNKKGVEGGGFSIVAGLVILVISAIVIMLVVQHSAKRADEKVQVDLCRVSNEIKMGTYEKTGVFSTPRVCNTIDKISEKTKVPSEKYEQSKLGAEEEIRDMIKNCWYMWLEGSKGNMFIERIGGKDCFVCYNFRVDEDIEGVSKQSILDSMSEPYFASPDPNTGCATNIGGFLRDDCSGVINTISGWREYPSKEAVAAGKKCCISTKIPNECENRGGKCFSPDDGPDTTFINDYGNKWSCPKSTQRCYIKSENMFSYAKYITQFGGMGGSIYFQAFDGEDFGNPLGNQDYAISFVSFGKSGSWWSKTWATPLTFLLKPVLWTKEARVKVQEQLTPGDSYIPNFMVFTKSTDVHSMNCIVE